MNLTKGDNAETAGLNPSELVLEETLQGLLPEFQAEELLMWTLLKMGCIGRCNLLFYSRRTLK